MVRNDVWGVCSESVGFSIQSVVSGESVGFRVQSVVSVVSL